MHTMLSCPIPALLQYGAPASAIDVTIDVTLLVADSRNFSSRG